MLPHMTTLRLPEMYGALALGHFANIEGNRLYGEIFRRQDVHRYRIYRYSFTMADCFHDTIRKLHAQNPDIMLPNVAYRA